MLVLTRKTGESIQINDDIRLTILSVQGQNVKVGVKAPQSVIIHRKEIYEKIAEENKRAARVNLQDAEKLLQLGGLSNAGNRKQSS